MALRHARTNWYERVNVNERVWGPLSGSGDLFVAKWGLIMFMFIPLVIFLLCGSNCQSKQTPYYNIVLATWVCPTGMDLPAAFVADWPWESLPKPTRECKVLCERPLAENYSVEQSTGLSNSWILHNDRQRRFIVDKWQYINTTIVCNVQTYHIRWTKRSAHACHQTTFSIESFWVVERYP